MTVKIMSVFSGVGGLEHLFTKDKKFELVGLAEIDDSPSDVLKYHHPNVKNYGDIVALKPKDLPDFDVLSGGFPCFKEGTLIYTSDGYKDIEDVRVGDYVLTHKNRFKRVYEIGKNLAPTVVLKCQGVPDTTTTGNHPYLSIVKTKGRNNRVIDDTENWVDVKDLTKDNFVGLPTLITNSESELSNTELWMLGRFVADGYCQNNKRKDRKNSYNTKSIFCIGHNKVGEFEKMTKDYHLTITRSPNKTVVKYIISKREAHDLFKQCGHLAHNKKFPNWVLNLPKQQLEIVLDGYLSGDGYLNKKDYWCATSVSKKLIMQLGLIVSKLYNVGSTFTVPSNGGIASIEGRQINIRKSYCIQFKKEKTKQANYHACNQRVWLPVRDKTETGLVETVYNFSVEDDESYVANNCIVHNCTNISTQGNMKGMSKGTKSSLFFYMLPIIKLRKPKYIIVENVKNLLSKQMRGDYEKIIESIEKLGYKTHTRQLDASNFGTPQARVRAIIFCVREDLEQIGESDFTNVQEQITKAKGFKGLDDNCNYLSWSKSTRKEHIDFRIREDGLINTLTTGDGCKGASTGTIVVDTNDGVRNLTVNECEALMTWPKDFSKYGINCSGEKYVLSNAKRYRICGNGVVSNMLSDYKKFILKGENNGKTIQSNKELVSKTRTRRRRRKSNR